MSHYFTDNPKLQENRREISFRFLGIEYSVLSDDGVFSKSHLDPGTEILLKACMNEPIHGKVCDLGCGIGMIGIVLSNHFDVVMHGVDVNPRAVSLANENYKRCNVNGSNIVSDGISGTYDFIVSNPPIRVGKAILYRLFEEAHTSLHVGGAFYFVIRKSHGAKSAQAFCLELFGNCEMISRDRGYHIYKCLRLTT